MTNYTDKEKMEICGNISDKTLYNELDKIRLNLMSEIIQDLPEMKTTEWG